MKKTKLLISFASLALVISLSGCSETAETDPWDKDWDPDADYGDPVADLFDSILETSANYTINIEYYEIYSDVYSTTEECREDYQNTLQVRDRFVDIIFTEDATLIYSYLSPEDREAGNSFYTELYNNNYTRGSLDIYYVEDDGSLVRDVVFDECTWQDYIWSLLDFYRYEGEPFEVAGTEIGDYGPEVYYSFPVSGRHGYEFYDDLVLTMFYCSNVLSDFSYVMGDYLMREYAYEHASDIAYDSRYYVALDEWCTTLDSGMLIWDYEYLGLAFAEHDTLSACVHDVGTSVIPDEFDLAHY